MSRSVADTIKTIISLGAVTPDYVPGAVTASPVRRPGNWVNPG